MQPGGDKKPGPPSDEPGREIAGAARLAALRYAVLPPQRLLSTNGPERGS